MKNSKIKFRGGRVIKQERQKADDICLLLCFLHYKYKYMKIIAIAIALLLTLTISQGDLTLSSFNGDFSSLDSVNQQIPLSQLINVANYYGCKTWAKDQCLQCSNGYSFNKKGVCCQISDLCSQFNKAEGVCQSCYQGYSVVNGSCQRAAQDNGCSKWNGNVCIQCSQRWFFDTKGICQPVSDKCATWQTSGNCLTCYGGFILSSGACIVNPHPIDGSANPLCATWNGKSCLACAVRAYFNKDGICVPVSSQCQTWDPIDGECFTCYSGYTLSHGVCNLSPISNPSDAGCSLWSANLKICLKCSDRFFFDANNKCTAVSDFCATWDKSSGQCLSCYDGYDLSDGTCCVSLDHTDPSDVGCASWDWKNNVCLKCSNNWVFNNKGVCIQVSDQCNTYDRSGVCVSCYKGYNLKDGACVLAPIQQVADVGCASWNWNKQICLQCSNNWVFSNGVCIPVSDQCATFDNTGACVTCYKGYNLKNGKCHLAPTPQVSDVGCATWNWDKQICLQCSNNYVFNSNKVCIPVSDQCATFDKTGACISCYVGYNLLHGKCQLAPIQHVTDVGCATWNWNKQICLQCSNNWVFDSKKNCIPVSDQCATFDHAGACVTCYKGYNLKDGKCSIAPAQQVSDVGCANWDWNKQCCLQCSKNWVFNQYNVCVPVSDQCATFNSAGACVTCYNGYNLAHGKCVLAPIQQVTDVGCATWDWNKQVCLKCSNNWVFSHGVCIPVSDQCATFDNTGACVTCYKGYNLKNGKCHLAPTPQVSDVGCATWNWDSQVCLQCSVRFVFNSNKVCVPVSDNCNTWDNNGACTSCYSGYVLNNGACQGGNSLCKSSNASGACTDCYVGYLLNNGNCVPLSKLANLALYYSVCCPERLAQLDQTIAKNQGK